ncbi:hypothetical protein NSU_2950 [Novosphingobium pentaromativorans US6-1]|uniref:Uncharacterized protein n=1 Tax=Novosphingobium pentaromativorans US6-1 TaxID=1088721 RepID=G6EF30_9SPHN|nr:hypothetical protein NSU_2950 [Novosphingobium pentaromativorans US6-1]
MAASQSEMIGRQFANRIRLNAVRNGAFLRISHVLDMFSFLI